MSYEKRAFGDSFAAAADYSAKQFWPVKLTAANTVTVCSGATDVPIGILQNKPKSGEAADVMCLGVTRAVSDGTTPIAVGDWVGSGAAGKLVKKSSDKDYAIGQALEASSADGTVISVLLRGPVYLGV
jgi:hypothetical protein